MQIVGHRLTKIVAEREQLKGNLTISLKPDLKKVEVRDIFPGGEKKKGLAFDFSFSAQYGNNSGSIMVEGTIFGAGEEKDLKKIEKDWKADKIEPAVDALVKNRAMVIFLGKAVPLADSLNLPLPMNMPGKFVPPSEVKK